MIVPCSYDPRWSINQGTALIVKDGLRFARFGGKA
jgi:hypothetical protein